MGQQQTTIAPIIGQSYPQQRPTEISQLQECIENGTFTEVDQAAENTEEKKYKYLVRSQKSTHVAFGISFVGENVGKDVSRSSGSVQIYLIESGNQKDMQICFQGEIQKRKRKGFGIEYYKGQIFYQGFFQNNKYDGWGITKTYEGEWSAGRKNGFGKFKSNFTGNKRKNFTYEGSWKDDKFYGLGAKNIALANSDNFLQQNYISQNAKEIDEQYIGQWLEGVKLGCGKSIKYQKTNDKIQKQVYEGQFARNKYQGRGKLTTYDGQTFEGKFDQDKFISPA